MRWAYFTRSTITHAAALPIAEQTWPKTFKSNFIVTTPTLITLSKLEICININSLDIHLAGNSDTIAIAIAMLTFIRNADPGDILVDGLNAKSKDDLLLIK